MATFGIEYRPQFVQSDVGAMQRRMDELQQAYDQSYMGALAAEDQFNAFEVDPRDIGLKNEVIGNFRKKVQDILTQYGGDWGAASKAIAKQVIATKQDPFFATATRRHQLAEEERKFKAMNPDAVILKSVRDFDLKDKEGKYIDPSQLDYQVTTRGALMKQLEEQYRGLADDETPLGYTSKGAPAGYTIEQTARGILAGDVNNKASEMFRTLKQQNPELSDDVAADISLSYAKSLVGGISNKTISDKQWDVNQDMNVFNWKLKRQAEEDAKKQKEQYPRPFFAPEVSTLEDVDDSVAAFAKAKSNINSIASNIREFKLKIADIDKQIAKKEKLLSGHLKNPAGELKQRKAQLESKLNSLRAQYISAEKSFGPMYNELKKSGLSVSEAITAIENTYKNTEDKFRTILWSENKDTSGAVSNYETYSGKFYIQVGDNKKPGVVDGNLSEYLNKEGTSVVGFGTDFSNGMQVLKLRHKGGSTTKIYIPSDRSSNEALNIINRGFKNIKNAYEGGLGIGTFIPLENGDVVKFNESNINKLPNGYTVVKVAYDPESKRISSTIHKVFNGALTRGGQYGIDMEADNTAIEIDRILGNETNYSQNELNGGY